MSQLDALRLVESVRQRLGDLAVSENFFRDSELSRKCETVWNDSSGTAGGLISRLWIEGVFPQRSSGETLRSLADSGSFPADLSDHLDRNEAFRTNLPLYTHQHESLTLASDSDRQDDRPAVVVRAGTGGGKTEAFLLPVLRDLWENPRQHGAQGGMR